MQCLEKFFTAQEALLPIHYGLVMKLIVFAIQLDSQLEIKEQWVCENETFMQHARVRDWPRVSKWPSQMEDTRRGTTAVHIHSIFVENNMTKQMTS